MFTQSFKYSFLAFLFCCLKINKAITFHVSINSINTLCVNITIICLMDILYFTMLGIDEHLSFLQSSSFIKRKAIYYLNIDISYVALDSTSAV